MRGMSGVTYGRKAAACEKVYIQCVPCSTALRIIGTQQTRAMDADWAAEAWSMLQAAARCTMQILPAGSVAE